MQQMDMFEETLEKEIYNLKKWMSRLQKRLWFFEEVYKMSQQIERQKKVSLSPPQQINMFGT